MRNLRQRELKQIAQCHTVYNGALDVWLLTPGSLFIMLCLLPFKLEYIVFSLEVVLYVVTDCTLQKWPYNYIDFHMLFQNLASLHQEVSLFPSL